MITGQVHGDQWIFAKNNYCWAILLQAAWTITVSQHPARKEGCDMVGKSQLTLDPYKCGKVNENWLLLQDQTMNCTFVVQYAYLSILNITI